MAATVVASLRIVSSGTPFEINTPSPARERATGGGGGGGMRHGAAPALTPGVAGRLRQQMHFDTARHPVGKTQVLPQLGGGALHASTACIDRNGHAAVRCASRAGTDAPNPEMKSIVVYSGVFHKRKPATCGHSGPFGNDRCLAAHARRCSEVVRVGGSLDDNIHPR